MIARIAASGSRGYSDVVAALREFWVATGFSRPRHIWVFRKLNVTVES